jgi:subtilisin family serine protease
MTSSRTKEYYAMNTENFIILRNKGLSSPTFDNLGPRAGARAGASGGVAPPEAITIEEAELTKAERSDLRRDPEIRAVAPPMPMQLVKPVDSVAIGPSDSGVIWGVRSVKANESPFDGSGISVAVLDTGIDPDHPAFAGCELVRKNFTTESDNDLHGHGTHCAGTIFGRDVGGTRIGIARNVKRALIGKVLGKGGNTSATIAHAIEWAVDGGANVISMSLGIDFPGYVDMLVNQAGFDINPATSLALEAYRANVNLFTELSRYVQMQGAFGQGTLIIAASGNESKRPEYEIAVAPPAAGTGVVSVGALQETNSGLAVAYFSNNQVDIAAPGVNIISAALGGGLRSMSGTSMATPHVAGVAVLWAQRQLEMTGRVENMALLVRLLASGTVTPLVAGIEEEDVGTGIVQAPLL